MSDNPIQAAFLSPVVLAALVALAGSAVAGAFALIRGRGKAAVDTEAAKQELAAKRKAARRAELDERFEDLDQLMAEIDKRVDDRTQSLRDEVKRLGDELAEVKRESHDTRDAFRAWVSAVSEWDRTGRRGPLPMPPAEVLRRLGLSHIAPTP